MSNDSLSSKKFGSAKELEDFMANYAIETGYKFSKKNTKSLKAAPLKTIQYEPELGNRYYDFKCIRYGKYIPTGKGIKKSTSLKTDCPVIFQARITGDGQSFYFKKHEENHNHPREVDLPEPVQESDELQSTSPQSEAISTTSDATSQCVNSSDKSIVVTLPIMREGGEAGQSSSKEHDENNTFLDPVQNIIIITTAENDKNMENINFDNTETQLDVQAQIDKNAHSDEDKLNDMEKEMLSRLSEECQEVVPKDLSSSIDRDQPTDKNSDNIKMAIYNKNEEAVHKDQQNDNNNTGELQKGYNAVITSVEKDDREKQSNVSLNDIEFPEVRKTRGRPRGLTKTAIGLPRSSRKTQRNVNSSELELPAKIRICKNKLNTSRVLRSSKKNLCDQPQINSRATRRQAK